MMGCAAMLLLLSVVLAASRNMLSKNVAGVSFATKKFFAYQTIIFGAGSILLLLQSGASLLDTSAETCAYALVYGVMLLTAQWCYTAALAEGKVAICSAIYSMGFVLPTIWSATVGGEEIGILNILGIVLVCIAIALFNANKADTVVVKHTKYVFPLLLAMTASGILGILQKQQQLSQWSYQKDAFVSIAFMVAALISAVAYLFWCVTSKDRDNPVEGKRGLCASGVGVCFAGCNILNTTLAGILPGALLFPILNVGTILFSIALAVLLYKERLTRREGGVVLMSAISILLLNA